VAKFEGFPEIQNTSLIKDLLSDLLTVKEESRIRTGEVLTKYRAWLDVDIDLTV